MTTRAAAQQAFQDAGLTYDVLTTANINRLITNIENTLKEDPEGSLFKVTRHPQTALSDNGEHFAFVDLRCQSQKFAGRQLVTFEHGGAIGLIGWADDDDAAPVISGFMNWVEEMALASGKEQPQL